MEELDNVNATAKAISLSLSLSLSLYYFATICSQLITWKIFNKSCAKKLWFSIFGDLYFVS